MRWTRGAALLGLVVSLGAMGAACGSRSGLKELPPAPPKPLCNVTTDCPGFDDLCHPVACLADGELDGGPPTAKAPGECVALTPVDCDDNDPCTTDTCEPSTGLCRYAHVTLDLDGDGHFAPLPGHHAGDPGSCGDDCDDTNAAAHPGAVEVCDGADNDCNGVVDDGAMFVPLDEDPVRISGDIAPAGPGGLAFSGTSYAAMYTGTTPSGFQMFSHLLSPTGETVAPETPFVITNGDSSGGPVVWIGDRYGTVWDDRRSGDYEIFFAEMQQGGEKIAPGDIRLTFADGFSINPTLTWNGQEFLVAWQDDRNDPELFDIFAQRVALDGSPIGSNVQLTQAMFGASNESPIIATGVRTVGVAWNSGTSLQGVIEFQPWNLDLSMASGAIVRLTEGNTRATAPTVVWNKDRYVVAWFDGSASPAGIYAATVDEAGQVLAPARAISFPGAFHSRYPALRALGDRILVVYSDDRDQNSGYELYSLTIAPDLSPMSPEQRLTHAARDSLFPFLAFGPGGDLAILFRDDRLNGAQHVWFTRLGCVTAVP